MTEASWIDLPNIVPEEHRALLARLSIALEKTERGTRRVAIRIVGTNEEAPNGTSVLMLGPDRSAAMIESVENGATGYVPLSRPVHEIADAARAISMGSAVVPDEMLGALLKRIVSQRRERARALEILTLREREVFELAARGLNKLKIGIRLDISQATARTHLASIMKKLDLPSHAALVARAAALGFDTTVESVDEK